MTESKGIYDASEDVTVDADKFAHLQPIATEAERVSQLERDELIHQVSGECCGNQQELIERLADLVILARKWRAVCGDIG